MSRRTTILILAPGRNAISLDLPVAMTRWISAALVLPLMLGVAAQRAFGMRDELPSVAMGSLHRITGSEQESRPAAAAERSVALPERMRTLVASARPIEVPSVPMKAGALSPLRAATIRAPSSALAALDNPSVISVKSILKALSVRRRAEKDVEPTAVPINGVLRLQALHLEETLSVRPFDDLLRPDARAFAQVNHVMRCRVTGHETGMDPRLVGILSQLSTFYGRTLQLISGHRAPNANGTSPTSQHTLGRAADIRVPGVPIAELKKVAIQLGARGVGLYPEKGFVHIDVRDKQRYYWSWTARGGEQADMGTTRPPKVAKQAEAGSAPSHDAHDHGEGAGEASDMGATSPGVELPPERSVEAAVPAADAPQAPPTGAVN